MIENGLILTGRDAELLSRAISEVKTKVYEEPETSLDDAKALDVLVSCFRDAEQEGQKKERRHAYLSPLGRRLMLGAIVGRQGGAHSRTTESREGDTGDPSHDIIGRLHVP
jgi:hypothetical protein